MSTTAPIVETAGSTIPEWTVAHEGWEQQLYRDGALLFRGFGVEDVEAFQRVAAALTDPVDDAREESSPRTPVGGNAFTSTEYPPAYPIQPHNEFSYRLRWPHRLVFCCLQPAEEGGATPLADGRRVLELLPPAVVERFESEGVLYVRNYAGLGVSWQDAFGTTSREEVDRYCAESEVACEWTRSGLRTTQRRPAVVSHPVTGERAWFNHALIWNVRGTEPPEVREALLKLPPELLPTNSFYGDGSPLGEDVIDELRGAYAEATTRFPWELGDVLLVDNALTAHGRDPYSGPRRVLVAMGDIPGH